MMLGVIATRVGGVRCGVWGPCGECGICAGSVGWRVWGLGCDLVWSGMVWRGLVWGVVTKGCVGCTVGLRGASEVWLPWGRIITPSRSSFLPLEQHTERYCLSSIALKTRHRR